MRTGSTGGSSSGSCASFRPSSCPRVNHRHAASPETAATAPGGLDNRPGAPASSSTHSPVRKKPRAPTKRKLLFNMSRMTWPQELTNFFITVLVDECRAGNRPHTTLNKLGKENVVRRMSDHTRSPWIWETCRHKWDELKKKWSCWKRLNQYSGLGFNPRTGVIEMPEQWWAARIRENPLAKTFKRTVLDREEDLDYIFQNMEPVNLGPNEDGGHEAGRAGVPTHYVYSDTEEDVPNDEAAVRGEGSGVPPQHIHPPASLPRRSGSTSGKRKWSDPMSGSAEFWDGFRYVVEDISSSKKQNSKDYRYESKKADDAEYEEFMRELIRAGVDPDSSEYIMASVVLLDVSCRGAYRPITSIDKKLRWINRMYRIMKGGPPPSP